MEMLAFKVQGSQPEPYEVVFSRGQGNLTGRCNCPAGEVGTYCKHRIALLNGDITAVVSDNADEARTLKGWLSGTDVEKAMWAVDEAEKAMDKAKKHLAGCKKALARVLND